jgi:hypothetical protein
MNPKRVVGIVLTVIVLLLLAVGVRLAQSPGVSVAEAPRVPPSLPAPRRSLPWPHPPRRSPARS